MSSETVTLFFALLTLALAVGLFVLAAAILSGRATGLVNTVGDSAVELAAAVALVSTTGSLYLSEVANFTPCRLCWAQRGFMYPAALLLLVAAITRRRALAVIAGALALVGLPIAVFHRYEQAAGEVGGLCDAANPCSSRWVEHFGFVTIPTMAAVGFVGVLSLVALQLFWRQP